MKFNVLVNLADIRNAIATTSCTIYGVEVADTSQSVTNLTNTHVSNVIGTTSYGFVQAELISGTHNVTDISGFFNNYNQFMYVPLTSTIIASPSYSLDNRIITVMNEDYPYACYNLPLNAGVALFTT